MHELSIARKLLELVRQHVPEARSPEVRTITVALGEMAGIAAESLQFCFSAIVRDTPLSQAALKIERVPVRLRCSDCGHTFDVEGLTSSCPQCDGRSIQLISGKEFQVVEIELAEAPDKPL